MITTSLLLSISIALPPESETELLTPPELPPWPSGLPEAQDTPLGTFIPYPSNDAIKERLMLLEWYPSACGTKLEGLSNVRRAEMKAAVDNCEAVCRERLLRSRSVAGEGFTFWEMLGVAAGSVAAGVLVGVIVGFAAGL